MALKIIETADGSSTFYHEELDETFHSRHGAIQEAKHVFLKMGLEPMLEKYSKLDILEIGFGTGLNAWLTSMVVLKDSSRDKNDKKIEYVGVEAYPILEKELHLLNYDQFSNKEAEKALFKKIHTVAWESEQVIHAHFNLKKRKQDFMEIVDLDAFDLIYFDAFGPRVQPELWSVTIFEKMFKALKEKGMLVTYSCKGDVRRAMLEVGFKVSKVPGPPGKREMLVAKKGDL